MKNKNQNENTVQSSSSQQGQGIDLPSRELFKNHIVILNSKTKTTTTAAANPSIKGCVPLN